MTCFTQDILYIIPTVNECVYHLYHIYSHECRCNPFGECWEKPQIRLKLAITRRSPSGSRLHCVNCSKMPFERLKHPTDMKHATHPDLSASPDSVVWKVLWLAVNGGTSCSQWECKTLAEGKTMWDQFSHTYSFLSPPFLYLYILQITRSLVGIHLSVFKCLL